jgi:hypothetical protein
VNVLVRILKLALCHIYPNEVVFERDGGNLTNRKRAVVASLGPGCATIERNRRLDQGKLREAY